MASLYVHVPFCERKCPYCDFFSVEESSQMDRFLGALGREATLLADGYRSWEFATLYLGGGTPSLLPATGFEELLRMLRTAFRFSPACEVTVEVNPGTVSEDRLRFYRGLGVNRLSIGVQSFRDDELAFLGRIHSAAEAEACIHAARRAGFENIGVDLIYSLPGQRAEVWEATLRRAVALGPEHISAYSLIIETGTPFSRMVREGRWAPNSDDREAALYERTMEVLESGGYEHYEVSNYARPGFRSRHNSAYWTHEDYLGLGPSAHSFRRSGPEGPQRWWNLAALTPYLERLEAGMLPIAAREHLDGRTISNEKILLGLRSDGVDVGVLQSLGGGAREVVVGGLVAEGLGVVEAGKLRLTRRGFVLCDEIARRLMVG